MKVKEQCSVLIVGAGPTGLTAAIELSRHGIACRIIDKLPAAVQTSNALAIQARTLEIWQQQGILPQALQHGYKVENINVFAGSQQIIQFQVDQIHLPSPYPFLLALSQHQTETILTAHLKSHYKTSIERSAQLIDLQITNHRVIAHYQTPHETKSIEAQWLIACDGSHSTVRRLSNLTFKGKELTQHFIMADLNIEGNLLEHGVYGFLAPQGVIAMLPLQKNFYRLICDVTRDQQLFQSKTPQLDDFIRLAKERCPIDVRFSNPQWLTGFWIHARVMEQFRHGRLFFAGDAAHVHSPFGGQGMNTGIQDAHNLAWKLALVINNKAPESLLDSYQQERHPVAHKIVSQTTAATRFISLKSAWLQWLRNHLFKWITRSKKFRYQFLLQASQLGIVYSQSAICQQDITGKNFKDSPQASQRFPFIESLQSLFDTTKFQLLLLPSLNPSDDEIKNLTVLAQSIEQQYGEFITTSFITTTHQITNWNGNVYKDQNNTIHQLLGATSQNNLYLVRPDRYISYRNQPIQIEKLQHYLQTKLFKHS